MTTSPTLDPTGRPISRARPQSHIPVFPFDPVSRPRLHTGLDAVVDRRNGGVLLICGQVGVGKTVSVADWAATYLPRTHPDTRIAWLTVRDQTVLWPELRSRLRVHAAGSGQPAAGVGEADAIVTALAAAAEPTVLVIDDAHLITDPLALAGLEYFLQHAPPNVTTVLCARFDPPIRWHLLQLHSRLTRWGAHDLALSPDEATRLCAGHECALDEQGLRTLMSLTEGWAALVRIAAIYLTASPSENTDALTALARPPHAFADLLVGELIDTLSPALRQFLTCTSVPEEFTEQLADDLVGGGAAHLLYELDRINFPMTSLSRSGKVWYSYHPMLRAYFLAEANRLGPDLCADLRLRAARQLTAAGELQAALAHLLAVPDHRPLSAFLSEHALALVFADHGESLFDSLAAAAPDVLTDPFLRLLQATDALLHGGSGTAQAYRDSARILADDDPHSLAGPYRLEALTTAVDAELAVATGAESEPIAFPDRMPPADRPDLDGYLAVTTGTALALRGELARGEERLRIALSRTRSRCHPRLRLIAVTRLAVTAGLAGSITTMRQRAERACAIARDHELLDLPETVHATALEAYGAYLQGSEPLPDQIRILCAEHIRRDGTPGPVAGWLPHVVGSLLDCQCAENPGAATDRLRRSIGRLLDADPAPVLGGSLLSAAVWALLGANETTAARQLVERARTVLGVTPDTVLSTAALTAGTGNHHAVVSQVEPVLTATSGAHPVARLTGWLLFARAHHQLGNDSKTREAVDNGLRIGATHRVTRPFLDVPGTIDLLDYYAGCFGHSSAFADAVRAGHRSRRRVQHPPLTATELRILQQLPSGRTTQHIADDLSVSINTVKTHLRGIYAKLGTRSRMETLQEARRSGLL
ncbi:LuxR C-terminal-related transcriptional regulator [Nocardia sp. NPDC051750]|uniref:LuxR C-terminal-related transcriptional regulator n=1 Tax=Nocardia sp. NPDC051750 TaxID=3364325 RepID=UPI0037A6FAE9